MINLPVTDELLVKKAQQGNLVAYGELVERYQHHVYSLGYKLLKSPHEAQDAAQEIFIRTHKALPTFKGQSKFSTWLYRIATNHCLDTLRRNQREQNKNVDWNNNNNQISTSDAGSQPEEALLNKEKQQAVKRSLDALPDKYRLPLILHHYQELSYRQTAEVLEIGEAAVATRIHRAKQMLKEKLSGGVADELSRNKRKSERLFGQ
ncbi:MAG: sigma-70 family RNA polymerase sigma factor [Firmicutes bacterium]|nr:sigma-70 family RNA polymerase sigma factor [Bacillota bacterium]